MTNRQISPHTASFEKIFREYYPVLLPFVERHVGERELAKDLVQDVFLKLYKSYPYFSSEVNINPGYIPLHEMLHWIICGI